jgi:hypothetical protein
MTTVATYGENLAPGSLTGFTTHPEFGTPVSSHLSRKDTGFFSGGLLSGILAILLLLYSGGGSPAIQPITFVFNKKARDQYKADQTLLIQCKNGGSTQPPIVGATIYEIRNPNVNMRMCPGFDCDPIYTLQPGMQIADAGGREFRHGVDWIRVSVNGREGWVSRGLLHLPGSPLPPTPNPGGPDSLRVRISDIWLRECPGLTCREIEPLPLGALVTNMGQSRPVDAEWWIRIRYGSLEGWVIRNTLE